MEVLKQSKRALDLAARLINAGGVVVCPTDTVYGFLADAGNNKAVGRIYKIKNRSRLKPLPVFVKDMKMAEGIAAIDKFQRKELRKHWPGKYTFVLKRKKGLKLYGLDKKTVALRIPKHKFLNSLLKKINRPLAQTSVNISGSPIVVKTEEIIEKFKGAKFPILVIDAGRLSKSEPSKIVDLTDKYLTRLR